MDLDKIEAAARGTDASHQDLRCWTLLLIDRVRQLEQDRAAHNSALQPLLARVTAFCRWFAPGTWVGGNPDHTAAGGPDGDLYNEAVRACRAGLIPRGDDE